MQRILDLDFDFFLSDTAILRGPASPHWCPYHWTLPFLIVGSAGSFDGPAMTGRASSRPLSKRPSTQDQTIAAHVYDPRVAVV
jgi:hypothetical protein